MAVVLGRALRRASRFIVAGGLTAYILWKIHPRAVLAAGTGADWRPIGIAVLLVLADRALMAYRWVVLLCTVEPALRPPLAAVMRIFFVSTFVGTFLPASVGGDAVRAYSLAKVGVRTEDAVASVFMDRILGVASVVAMAVIGLTFARGIAGHRAILFAFTAAAAVCVATVLMIFNERAAVMATHLIDRLPLRTLVHAGHRVLEAIRRYASYPGLLVNVLICSLAVQGLRIVQAYYLGRGLGIDAALDAYIAFVPIILLVMLLPVTFNGIGTSQAAFVWCFARVGVPAASAFALSLLFVALGIVGNLPGALLFVTGTSDGRRVVN